MTLVEKVEALVKETDMELKENIEAIKKAERLAEKFSDVKPQSYAIPMELYHGLPAFQNEAGSRPML